MSQLVAQIKRTQKLIPTLRGVSLSTAIDYTRVKPSIYYSNQDQVNDTLSILVRDANALINGALELGYVSDDEGRLSSVPLITNSSMPSVFSGSSPPKTSSSLTR
jgi:hydrogenase maturation factor